MNENKLFQVATKIGTPLSLASLIVVILYLIYRTALELPIFSNLTESSTFTLLNSIVNKVFILALIALVLGVISYLYSQYLHKFYSVSKKRSDVKLVDISEVSEEAPQFYPSSNNSYEPTTFDKLEVQDFSTGISYNKLPVIDLKVKNSGTDVAYLKKLTLLVEKSNLDVTPLLSSSMHVDSANNLIIRIKNDGWGIANNVICHPLIGDICDFLNVDVFNNIWKGKIDDSIDISVPGNSIIQKRLKTLDSDIRKLLESDATVGISLGNEFTGNMEYIDEHGKKYNETHKHSLPEYANLWLTNKGFFIAREYIDISFRAHILPTGRYEIMLEPKPLPYELTYTISHSVEPSQVERLHVRLVSQMSAFFKVRFHIHYDENSVLETPSVEIHINNPRSRRIDIANKDELRWFPDKQ